ncbi:ribulokinase [Paenibacillus sedimenti]|uniref:Ribulokinase n=1 Tax=Paenibacillus sedimenti TaxID=2770274 RepID=A0A926KM92_9BACL|nr:ribulokinase [Paenibacillus sedimenti]MBD0378863.1 ribulokinase [Paenibacillus sedimenti]
MPAANRLYTIGIDYGTQSGRAVLVDIKNGHEEATHVTPYRHGVIDEFLPSNGMKLKPDWALQHPEDYLEVLRTSVPAVIKASGSDPSQVIGIGIDFTACTMLPVDAEFQPLCLKDEWKERPHAWLKLWKHHAAQEEATAINKLAEARGERWLQRYGGKLSSEWMLAKSLQILNEDPEVYAQADLFVEAADWIVAQMTGQLKRNSCTAGYKSNWHKTDGYPSSEFLKQLHPELANLYETKLRGEVSPLGSLAGGLLPEIAEQMNLRPGIAVAVGNIDAHAAVPAVGVVSPGKMVMVMGTSTCHMLLAEEERAVEGICGVVEDGIIPGLFGYEAGQSAVGDIFGWFVDESVPAYMEAEAAHRNISIHELLEEKASQLQPGESGLLALDWHNGNRSTLMDADLTGLMLGMTLSTKPHEIYRALLEATAFGTRTIVEAFRKGGLDVSELYACGGLPKRNKLLMQIYADVNNMEIKLSDTDLTPAIGAAMFAAVVAGSEAGGYHSLQEAAVYMARVKEETVKPIPGNVEIYEDLYNQYKRLHDVFGKDADSVMKNVKRIRNT